MVEGDNEDLWLACHGTAMELHGYIEGKGLPRGQRGRFIDDKIIELADKIYDACKKKTKKDTADRNKHSPVVQLK